jgi:hypothetical protein
VQLIGARFGDLDWIQLAQDEDQWWVLWYIILNPHVPERVRNILSRRTSTVGCAL